MAVTLDDANSLIDDQRRELEKQRDLIDKKETFGAAMNDLVNTASNFDGVLLGALVPTDSYSALAQRAWTHRWKPFVMDIEIEAARTAKVELDDLLTAAEAEASTNATATAYETAIDALGRGFVTSVVDDADALCLDDVLACVDSTDPYTVHFDSADNGEPYMTDWLRTGIAYHEFAHTLQITNPKLTEATLEAFAGDDETMADCFALTYLDGWTLDHRIWVGRYQYWDISIGYGYTCNDAQRQAVRDWYGQLGVRVQPVSQAN